MHWYRFSSLHRSICININVKSLPFKSTLRNHCSRAVRNPQISKFATCVKHALELFFPSKIFLLFILGVNKLGFGFTIFSLGCLVTWNIRPKRRENVVITLERKKKSNRNKIDNGKKRGVGPSGGWGEIRFLSCLGIEGTWIIGGQLESLHHPFSSSRKTLTLTPHLRPRWPLTGGTLPPLPVVEKVSPPFPSSHLSQTNANFHSFFPSSTTNQHLN